jgi:uncharacterized Zn finger protein
MIAMNLQYFVYCDLCGRNEEIDLTKLPPLGKAIGVSFRCSQCGRQGTTTVNHRSAGRVYPGAKTEKAT